MNKKGFTLIELLVVISIIGLLSSVVLASLSTARMKARDTKRIQELKQLQNALELYRNDKGHYPVSGIRNPSNPNEYLDNWQYSTDGNWNGGWLKPALVGGGYISSLPVDPLNKGTTLPRTPGNNDYSYAYISGFLNCGDGECYDLYTKLESDSPYRCEIRRKKNNYDNQVECDTYSPYLYSPETP